MKITTLSFPSVFETAFGNNENSARDLLNGMKIKKEEAWYMVGNLARTGGVNPTRIINASPDDEDFEILFKAAMVNVADKVKSPLSLTMGFPFSTYNAYKASAEHFFSRRHFMVEHDSRTFNIKGGVKKNIFDIERFEIIPEVVGGIIGLKKLYEHSGVENFIALSFGFGTVEGGMATADGLVHRTCFSSHGIRYVIANLTRELNMKHYLELKNEHQVDEAFVKGSIFASRKRIDLTPLRKEVLTQYYKEVVSPLLRKYFTDQDLERCQKIYLFGGGAHYTELTNAVAEEFKGFIPVEVVENPEQVASVGYLYNSLRISDQHAERCIGMDLGNSSSIVSIFDPVDLPVAIPGGITHQGVNGSSVHKELNQHSS
ncbi:MAG TPA: ParM/StbA family protein [Flavisolibacter sp.]|nr:ParM/StbA family protein [Flavisolibacter sp.]